MVRLSKAGPQNGFVYYLLVGDLLKIGYTQDMGTRMRAYPPNRKLLAVEKAPNIGLEGQRHREFRDLLAGGNEWFRFEGELVEHVRRLRANAA